MTKLGEIQRLLWDAITHPSSVAAFLEASDDRTRTRFEHVFAGSDAFPAVDRVEVYARAYFHRLLDVLKEQFPVVLAHLGADAFHNLVTDYLLAHPSRSPNLHHLGDDFPDFLARHTETREQPYLADFASVELALGRAIEARDGNPVQAAMLASISPTRWPALEFSLVPSAVVLDTRFDLAPAHRAVREGVPLPEPVPGGPTLVWRRGFVPCFRQIPEQEAAALGWLAEGASFGAIAAHFETRGDSPEALMSAVARWVDEELLESPAVC
jgi:hypothetical protein